MNRRISWGLLSWVLGWLVLVAVCGTLLWGVRTRIVAQLDRPEVRAEWQRWKSEAERQGPAGQGPVQRRPPRSNEPPALILMRDHFSIVVASALVLGSCLYLFLAIATRGAWRTRGKQLDKARPSAIGERESPANS